MKKTIAAALLALMLSPTPVEAKGHHRTTLYCYADGPKRLAHEDSACYAHRFSKSEQRRYDVHFTGKRHVR